MSQMPNDNHEASDKNYLDELERQLREGITQHAPETSAPQDRREHKAATRKQSEEQTSGDIQGALGLFAEATQDMATAGVELSLGRHFACVDFCNQAVEKAAQAVSLLHYGRRSMYSHDLGALGALIGAPTSIQENMAALTPFHPEAFYADTPPEEADEIINAEQARDFMQKARTVLRWARGLVLSI